MNNDNNDIKVDLAEDASLEPNVDKETNDLGLNMSEVNLADNANLKDNADCDNPSAGESSNPAPSKARKPLGILLMIVLIGAAIAVLCVVLFLPQKSDVFELAKLTQREVESIAKYNSDNGTKYKSLTLDILNEKQAKVYSGESGDILLEERITISDSNERIIFYALNNSNRVDILDEFFSDSYSRMEINEKKVTFEIKLDESKALYTARFACIIGDNAYYVESISSLGGRWTELAQQLTK